MVKANLRLKEIMVWSRMAVAKSSFLTRMALHQFLPIDILKVKGYKSNGHMVQLMLV